ncbi:MAG: tripartite tricarboxylate transporter substrate binding protein [Proteobacteria bacterium]|nr:tripartite tricarboxylate transporter substrate binding protein [Pseudomonadota bacterium]
MRRFLVAAAFAVTSFAPALAAGADDYPTHPLKLIVPFAPGGGNDTVARAVAQKLAPMLGQPIVVDNRGGAGGALGAELAAHSPADGYTLFLGGVGSQVVNPLLHAKLPYDADKDFAPVAMLAKAPLVLVVRASVPARDIAQFIALAKAKPGTLNYASNGNGSSSHLAALMFASMAGIDIVHVPYKGLAPALKDLLAGDVQLMFSSVVAILPHIKSGELRALAVTGSKRLAILPDVPTVAEAGLTGYEAASWYGLFVPAGTPPAIVDRLNADVQKVLADADVQRAFANDGAEAAPGSPAAFAAYVKADRERLGKVVRAARLTAAE